MMLLVVHKLLGFRRLRGVDFYRDDPLMKHFLGLRKIPDVATISRHLKEIVYQKQKKGARGYYPLMCTVAETSQVLGMLHRPGNVHDSNGATLFALQNIVEIRKRMPRVRIESRCDSAFSSEVFFGILNEFGVEFTVSVPFERFAQLKQKIVHPGNM